MKSLLSELRKILRKNGYNKTRLPVGLFNGMRASVYGGHRHTVVVIEELVVPCSVQIGAATQPRPLKGGLAEVFRRLRKSLTCLSGDLRQTTLVLPGGGKLPMPKSFRDWAERQGIQIMVIGEHLPSRLLKRIANESCRRALPNDLADIIDRLD